MDSSDKYHTLHQGQRNDEREVVRRVAQAREHDGRTRGALRQLQLADAL